MKKYFILPLLALAWCLFVFTPTQAAPVENYWEELTGLAYDACNEEFADVVGKWHYVVKEQSNNNRGIVFYHSNLEVTGIGPVTGDRYYGVGTWNNKELGAVNTDNYVSIRISNYAITNLDTGSVSVGTMVVHGTYNANGELTADVNMEDSECIEPYMP